MQAVAAAAFIPTGVMLYLAAMAAKGCLIFRENFSKDFIVFLTVFLTVLSIRGNSGRFVE